MPTMTAKEVLERSFRAGSDVAFMLQKCVLYQLLDCWESVPVRVVKSAHKVVKMRTTHVATVAPT